MRAAVANHHAPRLKDAGLIVGAAILCLAVGKLLPGLLGGLKPSRVVLVPAALVFLLVVGWLSVVRPRAAFVLAFALLGIVRVQPAPVDAVFAILIATTFAIGGARPRIPAFVGIPLTAFALLTLLSMVNATDISRAIQFEFITIYMIGLAVWLTWAFSRESWVHVAMKTYIIVAAVSGALGPIALYLPVPEKSLLTFGGDRAQALFKDANVYSAFLIPAAIILLEELTSRRFLGWRTRTVALAFALTSIGVVVAFSRAGWLDYSLAVATLLFVQASRQGGIKRAFKSVGVLLVCGALGLAVLSASGSLKFLQERSHLQSYDTERFSNQTGAFDSMTHHVFGYGPGQAEVKLPISTHSIYVRAAFEQGLLGVTMLVLVLAGTLVCAVILARRRLDVQGVGTAALLAIWLGQMANSFFIDTLHWRHIWIVAGLIWCGYAMLTSDRSQRSTPA
jgi:hypothetical protein